MEQWLQRHPEAGSSWPFWTRSSWAQDLTSPPRDDVGGIEGSGVDEKDARDDGGDAGPLPEVGHFSTGVPHL